MRDIRYSRVALLAFGLGLATVLAIVLSGFGVQWRLWDYRTGFSIMRIAAWSGLGIVLLSFFACLVVTAAPGRRGLGLAAAGLICGVLAFAIPASYQNKARTVPRLHDVTTDTGNPPQFVALLPLRAKAGAHNPATYPGEKLAALQARGYPDIRPLVVRAPTGAVFDAALELAADRGWDIVAVARGLGRIEATARTFWYGFSDDIVIRVAPDGGMTRVDIRSVSRVGRSDVGANAVRIRGYLARLQARLGLSPRRN